MKKLAQLTLLLSILLYVGCNTSKQSTSDASSSKKETMMVKTGGDIKFFAENQRYSAEGMFKEWYFTKADMKKGDLESLTASMAVDLTSISEKNEKLTEHLKAPDFFNIGQYTTATIDISNVTKKSDDTYTADMKLNMKGLTQDLTSEFKVTSMDPLHVVGEAKIDRALFSLGTAKMGVGDMIKVTYDTDVPTK